MRIDFNPLKPDAVRFLAAETAIDFSTSDFSHWFCVTARDGARIMGVAVAEPKTWFDWHFSCAIRDQRCMSRRLLHAIFTAIFSRAVRITALVSPDNARAVRQMTRMGFVLEGFCRKAVEGSRDALVFGMLAEDCRYLRVSRATQGGRDGVVTEAARSL
jgi:hypothetical protein